MRDDAEDIMVAVFDTWLGLLDKTLVEVYVDAQSKERQHALYAGYRLRIKGIRTRLTIQPISEDVLRVIEQVRVADYGMTKVRENLAD